MPHEARVGASVNQEKFLISGFGFCDNAHLTSHLTAAALDGKRCSKRKSSICSKSLWSITKDKNGFRLGMLAV